jgi:hypothetical protein
LDLVARNPDTVGGNPRITGDIANALADQLEAFKRRRQEAEAPMR